MVLSCGHTAHHGCLEQYCNTEVEGGKLVLNCPIPECRRELEQREARVLIGEQAFAKIDRLLLEQAVFADPTLHLCATPNCNFVSLWTDEQTGPPRFRCQNCRIERCLLCRGLWHGDVSCEVANAAIPVEEAEAATAAYLREADMKQCAQCGIGVEKSSGCFKVSYVPGLRAFLAHKHRSLFPYRLHICR